ncbi:hypothetical protein A2U01_0083541, partial [Trifolium medium]|nr:hypothetical protein [Trifolium medium]
MNTKVEKQIELSKLKQVPPPGKGTLYLRPLLMGTGAAL